MKEYEEEMRREKEELENAQENITGEDTETDTEAEATDLAETPPNAE